MTIIDGFRLEFDDGTVFEATKNVDSTHSVTPIYLVDGLRNLTAIINEYFGDTGGQPGRGDSNMAGVFGGFGAGVHEIQIEFTQYEGSTDSWGGAADGDHALSKRDRLANALTNKKMDSTAVGLLRVGEYNPNGLYNEIPVVPSEVSLPYQTTDETTSAFRGTMTFYDAVDLSQAVSATIR